MNVVSLLKPNGIVSGAAMALCLSALTTNAASFYYSFETSFNGPNPSPNTPWINAFFQDSSPGTVTLAVTNVGLTSSEKVRELYFNLDPALNANNLNFTLLSISSGVIAPTISRGTDAFKADGDGKYDILLRFAEDGGSFGNGNYVVFQITGIPSLDVLDFNFLSAPAGGSGPFYAAAHVLGIGAADDSAWIHPSYGMTPIPVPEPSAVAFLTLAAAGLFTRFGRRS
jgi:hypothetical protein